MKYCPYCMNELKEENGICPQCGKNTDEYQHPAHTLKQGAILNNRYSIGGVIGEGGFGITYIGLDTLLQYRVAIKEFFPNGMVNRNNTVSNDVLSISTESAKELFSKSRDNFLREARTLAKFNNEPGIVAVKDFFEENHTVYIVMEYLDGITLKSYLSQVGKISPYNTLCLLMPVFKSLKKIHDKKLIHRDISPDNIMLVGEDVKLLDFGAAREFADERSLSVMLKQGYAPMEQYRRHGVQGAWTDVYAICATMYKCITGEIPPDAPDRVFEDELKMPSEMGIEIEPKFEKVLRHGLAVKPDERIQSIDELLEELDAVPGIDLGGNKSIPASAGQNENIAPADKGKTVAPSTDNDLRLSEYVPHGFDDEPERKSQNVETGKVYEETGSEPSAQEKTPDTSDKKKSRKTLIFGIAALLVLVAGIVTAVIVFSGNNSAKPDTPPEGNAQTESSVSEDISEISENRQSSVTSAEESSKPESKAESKSESSAAEGKSESKAESSATTSQASENSEVIVYPDLKNYFEFNDGMLYMMYSLFGKSIDETAALFPGTLYVSKDHQNEYNILHIPLDAPTNDENHIESIDLFFKNNKLVSVEFEAMTPFDNNIAKTAREFFGKPIHEEAEDILWSIEGRDISFTVYMKEYTLSDGTTEKFFTQKYFTSDAADG